MQTCQKKTRVAKRTQKIGSGAGEVIRATIQSYVLNGLVNDIEYPTSTVGVKNSSTCQRHL